MEKNDDLFSNDEYTVNKVEELVDENSGSILKKEDISPFDQMKAIAKKTGYEINNPKRSCKKCFGRGYIGFDITNNRSPIPCMCIYSKEDVEKSKKNPIQTRQLNRSQKRKLYKELRKGKR